jgi:hypothetical protein
LKIVCNKTEENIQHRQTLLVKHLPLTYTQPHLYTFERAAIVKRKYEAGVIEVMYQKAEISL